MNAYRRHLTAGQRHMIAARWVLYGDLSARAQRNEKMSVTKASKQIEVGERGVYHAINVIANGTPEEISRCDAAAVAVPSASKKITRRIEVRTPPPPAKKKRTGARISVPEGIESAGRKAMELESGGLLAAAEP